MLGTACRTLDMVYSRISQGSDTLENGAIPYPLAWNRSVATEGWHDTNPILCNCECRGPSLLMLSAQDVTRSSQPQITA